MVYVGAAQPGDKSLKKKEAVMTESERSGSFRGPGLGPERPQPFWSSGEASSPASMGVGLGFIAS